MYIIFFSETLVQKTMRVSRDTSERLRVLFAFMLEIYKVATGTLLSVFVAHNCPGTEEECSVVDSFHPTQPLSFGTLVMNGTTLVFVVSLYIVELGRENYMIYAFDIDPEYPDAYLDDVAPACALQKLRRWNKRYWKTAAVAMFMALANIVVSAIFLFQNYRSSATATACASFALLVLMKLYESFKRARRDNQEQRARSAFLTEDCSFNVMDEDYVMS